MKKLLSITLALMLVFSLSALGFADDADLGVWPAVAGDGITYGNLFEVILAEDCDQLWLDYCGAVVGEANAADTVSGLKASISSDLYGEDAPTTLVVYDPKAIREMNGYFSAEGFARYIHWAYVNTLLRATAFLSEELAALGKTYRRVLSGVAADPTMEKQAYQTASRMYSEPVGVYYGRTYFGEEAKKDVVDLVHKIIETYLNYIGFGGPTNGIEAAAIKYFGKNVDELDVAEAAVLAAIPQSPETINPFAGYTDDETGEWVASGRTRNRERQEYVLYQMY